MSVDISKIRVGDEIDVRCRVHVISNGVPLAVRLPHYGPDCAAIPSVSAIVAHYPAELKAGDRVRDPATKRECEVIGAPRARAEGERAEVALWDPRCGYLIRFASDLERVP
jgi:hypothetical protein